MYLCRLPKVMLPLAEFEAKEGEMGKGREEAPNDAPTTVENIGEGYPNPTPIVDV